MLLLGCGGRIETPYGEVPLNEATRVVFEVDFAAGALPATAPLSGGASPWWFFERNAAAVLPLEAREISSPQSRTDMGEIDVEPGRVFSAEEVLLVAREHRDLPVKSTEAHFHILFLDGTFESKEGIVARAAHIEGTRVIAVFGGVGDTATDEEKVLEQAALLHELGHAIGLVGIDVPETSPHADGEGSGHCSVPDCVMGSIATLLPSMQDFARGGEVPIVFGPECRRDLATAYASKP